MTRRRICLASIILLMIVVGVWAVLPKYGNSSEVKFNPAAKIVAHELPVERVSAPPKSITASDLWSRPTAGVAARNYRRYGIAWILRQLGATEDQLNRLANLDIADVIAELKQKARTGDPASINILEEIAYQNCYLGRDDATVESYVASQIRDVQAVPIIDASWFTAVMREDQVFYKKVHAACAAVNVDEVMSWAAAGFPQVIIPADDGQGFQSIVDSDSSGKWTGSWLDRGQFAG